MLKLILGAVNSTKSKEFNKGVKKACLNGEDVIVIVPDQYSFEYDKELYNEVGAKDFNSMEVIAFNRLCEKIVKQVGGVSGDFADENARLICMFYAVSLFQKSGSARHFKKALYKTGFCKEMIELVDELRLSGVDSTSLREAGALKGESLEDKTNDLADIFELYTSELEKRGLKDNSSLQSEAVKAARSSHYFKNKTVFIHEFSDFSHDEYDLITVMLSEAKSCVVSLIEGNGENLSSNFSPFKTTFDTKSNLIRIAKSMGSEVSVLKADGSLFESNAIEHISNNIFCPVKKQYSGSTDSVEVVRAKSMYEEAEYVAAKISKLCKQGYSYKDIAIFTRQIGEYYPIIESVFERYDIPVFGHTSQSAMMSPLAVYVTSIFDCVMTGEFRTENILRYIKSPLSKISEADACALEEYVYKWGVDRSLWETDFTGASTESEQELSHINQIRREAISPLVKFKENSKGKAADEICLALNELFNDIYLSDRAFSILSKSMESDDAELLETAREFKQIWRMFLSSINSVYKYLKGEAISLRRFFELLKTLLSSAQISNPPESLDAVEIARAEHSRLSKRKVCFVVGLNDGLFPSVQKKKSLLSDRDKERLNSGSVKFSDSVSQRFDTERLITYIALSTPTDKLILSYSLSDAEGKARRASTVITDVLQMFPCLSQIIAADMPASFYSTSEKSAFFKYFDYLSSDKKKAKSIRRELSKNSEYAEKFEYFDDLRENRDHKLSSEVAKTTFFSHDLNLTATRVEDYYKCPFNYFCKNGLKIYSPRKIEINPSTRGSLIHFCLEQLMCKEVDGKRRYNPDFEKLTDKEIREKVRILCVYYSIREWGGDFAKTNRFYESLKKLEDATFYVVKNIISEFKQSLFRPCAFEYDLKKQDGKSLLSIKVQEGVYINIFGIIDRVDVYDEGNVRYIRITDYKTGGKILKLSDLYNGLNMQMLIYLLALISSDNEITKDKNPHAAGILYMPAKFVGNFVDRTPASSDLSGDIEQQLEEMRNKEFKRDGLVVDNSISLEAMDKALSELYAPVKRKKDGTFTSSSKVLDEKLFSALFEFTRDKICELGNGLLSGDIKAKPIMSGNKKACEYCDYWSVCGNYGDKEPRTVTDEDGEELYAQLERMSREEA